MAEIVLGLCTSHTPQLNTNPDIWFDHVERDRRNPELLGRDGEMHTFDELSSRPEWAVDDSKLTSEHWQAMYNRSQQGVQTLADTLKRVDPDVVVIVGDDQHEMFLADGTPTFAIYWGDEVDDIPPPEESMERMPMGIREAMWAMHGEARETYKVASGLGKHIIEQCMIDEFDVAQLTETPSGRSIGHAFTFVRRRVMQDKLWSMLPVAINTYYPPNQPNSGRCYRFGQTLRRAIESYPDSARVAIVGSGGLSHFVVDEELDNRVLTALRNHDVDDLASIPRKYFRSGTSETLNWIAAAGALEHLTMDVVDYIPGYRSAAGTGVGMAFATWQ